MMKSLQLKWDEKADWYSKFEGFSFQGTVTCLNMVDSFNSDRLLEVGCGTGHHSELIAKSFTPANGLLVSCDFSTEMVKKMKERYAESDFVKDESVTVSVSTDIDHTTLEDSLCEEVNQKF
jgi:trans-aconitate methyltransferase